MRKPEVEKIYQFVEESTPTLAGIETILGTSLFFAFVTIAMCDNQNLSFYVLLPLMAMATIFYFVILIYKRPQKMHLLLFRGISGMIMSVTCLSGCLLMLPMVFSERMKMLVLLVVINLTGILYGIGRGMWYVRSKSTVASSATTIGTGAITSGIAIGRVISRKMDFDLTTIISICLAIVAWASSFFFIEIVRYYYACVLKN